MFTKGMKVVAGLLVGAIVMSMIPTDVFKATEEVDYMWDLSAGFTAGAHHAIEETIVLSDTEMNYIVSVIINGETPLVTMPWEKGPENPYENVAIANVDEYVNIRAAADENAEVLGKLYSNGTAIVIETLDGWYKVVSNKVKGYIKAEYLVVGDKDTCIAAAANGYTYAESKEDEAVRLAAEEAARQAEEAARLAAAEAARLAEIQRKQREEANRKNYVAPTGGTGQDVVDYAVQFLGNPYVLGGSSLTNGIDCSNFIMRVYEAFGVSLPHNSYELRNVGYEVSASEIKAGDIICYQGHVSIYMGDGRCIHAANREDGIKISPKWNYTRVITIRRIFN